jgi:hypothetical protein
MAKPGCGAKVAEDSASLVIKEDVVDPKVRVRNPEVVEVLQSPCDILIPGDPLFLRWGWDTGEGKVLAKVDAFEAVCVDGLDNVGVRPLLEQPQDCSLNPHQVEMEDGI